MTRAVRDRILKDANGDISDHLRNHIHLTNCIHLKNHMHKQSPILADRALIRDLIALQRSRSLRDPSASPPPWQSPSVVDLLPRTGENNVATREGRKSVGVDRPRDGSRRLSISSPPLPDFMTSKVGPNEAGGIDELNEALAAAISERSSKSGYRDGRRVRREESRRKSRTDFVFEDEVAQQGGDGNHMVNNDVVSKSSGSKARKSNKQKGRQNEDDAQVKTLSDQLNDVPMDSDDLVSSNVQFRSVRGYSNGLNRGGNRRKFRGARRTRAGSALREVGGQSEMSVASNSFGQAPVRPKHHIENEGAAHGGQSVSQDPRNGCGIPWNWSRIHNRGKTFLDRAGRSLTSCGLSDSKLRKAQGRDGDFLGMPVRSDRSTSSTKSDAEALPLLVDASGSHESTENGGRWVHDYSGELGIFADHLLKHDVDSDLASEGRSGDRHKLGRSCNGRHQSLTQKYMPRTFRDLVGQNLVSQALSNAVARRKVGLLYVFYGPHGTGKSSCARIFARALNCQSLELPKPCGLCNSCVAHNMGKSRNIKEVGPVGNLNYESIMDLLENMVGSHLPSLYRIFVFDDCDTLSPDCWSAISKVIDRAPRRVVFILVSSSLDVLPHIIVSRCQKFFFPKLKDADIIYSLQWISSKEEIEIDKDALKLIASRSDGSLRDAEMTLEQLSLLGQRISLPLVQELVGLISDEKLVDLLDLALSADTVNTVKNLRVIMETGVEPLALMSQLATVITDILAGSYDFTKDRHRRKFFRRQPLSKEDMEKLRQALKTLSEAEKQLRMSNDKLTWLTAALLQLAPDQQYILPSSSADTSNNHSPLALNNMERRDVTLKEGEPVRLGNFRSGELGDFVRINNAMKGVDLDKRRQMGVGKPVHGKGRNGIEEIWLEVLKRIQNGNVKEFLYQEGKLVSVSFGQAPTVQLMFTSQLTKSTAEKFKDHILQAFESVINAPVTIEIRCEPTKDSRAELSHSPLLLPPSRDMSSSHTAIDPKSNNANRVPQGQLLKPESLQMVRSNEIVEEPASPRRTKDNKHVGSKGEYDKRGIGNGAILERRKLGEQSQSMSIVRSKVSLAHVIQQAEGRPQQSGWSKRKAVSIAEKLEQENLRLEPRSRSLLCWKASRVTRRKLSRLKVRTRKPHSLLKLVSCGRCLSSKSPR